MAVRVNLYEEEFDKLISDRGHNAEWERAAVCHCVTKDTGQPNFLCPVCGGSGYRYIPPQKIQVAISSISGQIELKTLETREPGIAYVTPKSNVIMGYKDRLRFPDFKCVFSEVLHWSEEEDGRGISQKTYRNIVDVISLMDERYEYELGIDFEITEDRHHLRWLNQDYIRKLDGKSMSFLYMTTPSYLVIDLLHELRATLSDRKTPDTTFRELPKQYKLQREDFIYNIVDPEPVKEPPINEETDSDENLEEESSVEENPEETQPIYNEDGSITV